jgi:hypothetical protein
MSAKCPRVSRLPCHKVWATDPEFAGVRKLRNSRNCIQIAGSSGSADITELANWHNYNYLPAGVNTTPDFLTPYITTGYDQRATAVPSTRPNLDRAAAVVAGRRKLAWRPILSNGSGLGLPSVRVSQLSHDSHVPRTPHINLVPLLRRTVAPAIELEPRP